MVPTPQNQTTSERFSLNLIGCGDTKKHATLHTKVKAAHVRVMLGFVAAKALALCDGSRQSRSRSCCIWGLARFCYLCDHAGHWMDQEPLRDCLRAGMLYLMSLGSAGLVFFLLTQCDIRLCFQRAFFCCCQPMRFWEVSGPVRLFDNYLGITKTIWVQSQTVGIVRAPQ